MLPLVILIPALIETRRHLEMLRVHTLTPRLLENPAFPIETVVVLDNPDSPFRSEIAQLPFTHLVYLSGERSGIRRPTEYGLRFIRHQYRTDVPVLRIIQDTVITHPERLWPVLADMRKVPNALAGALETCTDIGPLLDDRGLPQQASWRYIQGAFMLARLELWERHYPSLPSPIIHHCDDSVMSQSVLAAGGSLHEIAPAWEHRHDGTEEEFRSFYAAHHRHSYVT